ncbi:MAG: NifB/NifX family molybdenum-iron cluster-binding protein [Desulfobacterales bacterium]|jgi:predicted Fe-Mo cluster-binding NifX family protein
MARKFVFIKDVENLLKQGKTDLQLPEGSRFSPAAWDLIRENNIQVSYTDPPSAPVDIGDEKIQDPKIQEQPAPTDTSTDEPQLAAIVSAARDVSGTVGEKVAGSQYFLIFDHDGKFIDIIKNPFFDRGKDAEQGIVNLLAASQVAAIVAEKFDEALGDRLTQKNIQFFEISGPIEEAVKLVFNQKGGDKSVPKN